MKKIDKAYNKLKDFITFSPNYETFESMFLDNLKKDQTDIAIELLLQVVYKLLTSPGEKFNDLLSSVDEQNKHTLQEWLNQTYKAKVKKVKNV